MFMNPTKAILDDNPVFAKLEGDVLLVQGDPWTMAECEEAGLLIVEGTPEEVAALHAAGYPIPREN